MSAVSQSAIRQMRMNGTNAYQAREIVDQFDNPFMHEAFLKAGEDRIYNGDVRFIDVDGYRLAYLVERPVAAFGFRVARFMSHGYAPVGAALFSSDGGLVRSPEIFARALDALADHSGVDLALWSYFPLQSMEFEVLGRWVSDRVGENANQAILRMGTHERAFLDASRENAPRGLSWQCMISKRRKEISRLYRRLEDLATVEVLSTHEGFDQDEALRLFMKVEASGWKAVRGTALASNPTLTAFVEGFLPQLIRENKAQIDLMMLGDECIAGMISLLGGRGLFTWKIGMNEMYRPYSPGVQMMMAVSRRAIADPRIDYVDSLADAHHPMVDRLWRGRRRYAHLFIPLNASGRLASYSLRSSCQGLSQAKSMVKKMLGRI